MADRSERRARELVVQPGIRLLHEAWERAREVGLDLWQFALEIRTLRSAGLSSSELRWLLSRDLLQHAEELTGLLDSHRRFQPIGSLLLTARSCFVLTEYGYRFAIGSEPCASSALLDAAEKNGSSSRPDPAAAECATAPDTFRGNDETAGRLVLHWDPVLRELRLGPLLVKRFNRSAPLQDLILAAFQEEGWPCSIYDPLPPKNGRLSKRGLQSAIQGLNRAQKEARIRFYVNGNGESIRWEIVSRG